MFKRILLAVVMTAVISAGSTAMAGFPYRAYRSFYAPVPVAVPVVRSYSYYPRAYSYRPPVRSYYYSYPTHRAYYAPAPVYAPGPAYGGVSVSAPGVSVRIGF